MVQALLSQHSKAHSSRSAPASPVQMLQLHCSRLFKQPLSFLFPFFSLLFRTLCLFWEHSRLLRSRTFSSSPSPPPLPNPVPSLRAGGHGAVTHHLVITGTKGALVATVAAARRATPLGREWRKVPHLEQFPSVLHRPHLLR